MKYLRPLLAIVALATVAAISTALEVACLSHGHEHVTAVVLFNAVVFGYMGGIYAVELSR